MRLLVACATEIFANHTDHVGANAIVLHVPRCSHRITFPALMHGGRTEGIVGNFRGSYKCGFTQCAFLQPYPVWETEGHICARRLI